MSLLGKRVRSIWNCDITYGLIGVVTKEYNAWPQIVDVRFEKPISRHHNNIITDNTITMYTKDLELVDGVEIKKEEHKMRMDEIKEGQTVRITKSEDPEVDGLIGVVTQIKPEAAQVRLKTKEGKCIKRYIFPENMQLVKDEINNENTEEEVKEEEVKILETQHNTIQTTAPKSITNEETNTQKTTINVDLFNILKVQDINTEKIICIATLKPDVPVGACVLYTTTKITTATLEVEKTNVDSYVLNKEMTFSPNNINMGYVMQTYPLGEYDNEQPVVGWFISCIDIRDFYLTLEKQQSYDQIIVQLENRKRSLQEQHQKRLQQERQLYTSLAKQDPESAQLLQQLDSITGYKEEDNECLNGLDNK